MVIVTIIEQNNALNTQLTIYIKTRSTKVFFSVT